VERAVELEAAEREREALAAARAAVLSVPLETDEAAKIDKHTVCADTRDMPGCVQTHVKAVQARVRAGAHGNHALGLQAGGWSSQKCLGAECQQPDRDEHQAPRVRFFIPENQFDCDRPDCPGCGDPFNAVNAWVCRRVVDLNSTHYLVTKRYRCDGCIGAGKRGTYCTWDPEVLATMEEQRPDVFEELDVVLTHKNGMSQGVVDYITSHAPNGVSFQKIAEYVQGRHRVRADRQRLRYDRAVDRWNAKHPDDTMQLEAWGEFEDSSGYNGYTPGVDYFTQVYLDWAGRRSKHVWRAMQAMDGEILAGDASMKVNLDPL
jgi:hypothetical protein